MAAIMGVAGTARADTTTIIASQAYVDAKDALKQDNAKRIQTTKSAYNALNRTADQKKEDYPSMYTLEDSITSIGSDNFATKDLDNLTDTGKANVSAQGTYDSTATYATGTVGKAIQGKQDTLTFDTTPTASSTNPVTSGGLKTALDDKQDNLGGSGHNGKVVTATGTAGTVTYTAIDSTPTANSTNLVTSGGVASAISDANNAVTDAYANNALTREGLDASDRLAKMRAVQDTIARQGTLGKAWSEGFSADDASTANATNLFEASKNYREGADMDNYVPTVAAVEKRVGQAVNDTLSQVSGSYATKNLDNLTDTGKANVSAQGTYDSTATYATGTVGKAIKDNAASITTLNGDVNTAGSVLKTIKDNAVTGTFDANENYATGTIGKAIKEAGTAAINGLDVTDTATNQPVVAVNQTDGAVSSVRGTITYKDGLESKLSNVNATGDEASAFKNCTTASPCTLTMIWSNDKPVYEWTNMDTENTNATL